MPYNGIVCVQAVNRECIHRHFVEVGEINRTPPTIHHNPDRTIWMPQQRLTAFLPHQRKEYVMSVKDMMQKMIGEYVDFEDFKIDQHLNSTLKQLGFDSLDQMELAYIVGEKLDLKSRIPDDLNIGQIVEHLETTIGDKILEDI